MFAWDSGWELGRVMRVNGQGKEVRQCLIQFDVSEGNADDTQECELRLSNYYSKENTDGIWVALKEK